MSEPIIKMSPELQKTVREVNQSMTEAAVRLSEVCRPINESLVEGMRRVGEIVRNTRV